MKKKNSLTSNSETIELVIDSLSYHGGRGVGRYDGVVVFVGGTVPLDRIKARITHKKSKFWEADLVEVLEPSPHRRAPPCPVADRCGGCSWQQVNYDCQIQQKEKILRDSLRGLVKYGTWETLPFLRAPDEFHYRNRIQVHFSGSRLGFYAKRTRDLVAIEKCWIADSRLNAKLGNLQAPDGSKVEVALNQDGEVLVMPGERDPEAALFAQVNEAQNHVLKKTILDFIEINPKWGMDLYAGSGNLTFPLVQRFADVPFIAIELSHKAVERGRHSSSHWANLSWLAKDVALGLADLKPRTGEGLIVVDPPRTGLSQESCDQILRHSPKQIIYVSCNPTTFARDAERFLRTGAYRLAKVQGLDMFPQTEHVELLASLCAAT